MDKTANEPLSQYSDDEGCRVVRPAGAAPADDIPAAVREALRSDHIAAAACYGLGALTGIAFAVWAGRKRDRKVRFHAFQSIFLHGAVLMIASVLTMFGGEVAALARPLTTLALLALCGFLVYKTFLGEKVVLPIVGPMAERQVGTD
jgi:uncharacterized membrane protein